MDATLIRRVIEVVKYAGVCSDDPVELVRLLEAELALVEGEAEPPADEDPAEPPA